MFSGFAKGLLGLLVLTHSTLAWPTPDEMGSMSISSLFGRDDDFDPENLSFITRIAAIGDSYSAGIGAGDVLDGADGMSFTQQHLQNLGVLNLPYFQITSAAATIIHIRTCFSPMKDLEILQRGDSNFSPAPARLSKTLLKNSFPPSHLTNRSFSSLQVSCSQEHHR